MSQSHPRRTKRFYWFEGVTRAEVERGLRDASPSVLHRQTPRRLLVIANALIALSLAGSVFIVQPKVRSYSAVILMALALWAYVALRRSVRLMVDAPGELLDERQLALRNAVYAVAYRSLAIISIPYIVLVIVVSPEGVLHARLAGDFWVSILWSYLVCSMSLPNMIMAWQLPSESPGEAR